MVSFTYLDQDDLLACGVLDMRRTLDVVQSVFVHHATGQALLPHKNVLRWGDAASEATRGRFNSMPGFIGGDYDVAGIKWISSMPANPRERDLPRGIGLLILNDPESGVPLAILEGTAISAVRTAAVSGVAARLLARPDTRVAGLIGAGVINAMTAEALRLVLAELEELRVFDLDAERARAFAEKVQADTGTRCIVTDDARGACADAGVVVTATTAQEPIIEEGWLAPGAVYSQMGGYECTFGVVAAASKVVVDDWEHVLDRGTQTVARMAAAGAFDADRLWGSLGEIAAGQKPGRENDDEIIVVAPIGLGLHDLALGRVLVDAARDLGRGRSLPLWREPFAV